MEDKTREQIEYDHGVMQIRDSIRELRANGTDFSKKKNRKLFTDNLINTAKRIAHDKRIWE